jgi:hypothetical protein
MTTTSKGANEGPGALVALGVCAAWVLAIAEAIANSSRTPEIDSILVVARRLKSEIDVLRAHRVRQVTERL